ncbi:hypothetical protein [Campylobacter jejuni]|uniref:hypothetical protein n=1 Tax=Campylobacter jejuni TaxID=197 RepID=UPI00204497C9|nr:hypothetical protein [Campylobacter jejuni]
MIFSLPNMEKWLENKFTNCLNFEHTIFLSENILEFLLQKHKFKIIQKQYFKEHSIFYHVCKDESINTQNIVLKNEYEKNKHSSHFKPTLILISIFLKKLKPSF